MTQQGFRNAKFLATDGRFHGMNKFIIVGHPSTDFESVLRDLIDCNLNRMGPGGSQGILPQEIYRIMRSDHEFPELSDITEEHEFHHASNAFQWIEMATDLINGNKANEPWALADPDAVFFLDALADLDPGIGFIFIYGGPESALGCRNSDFDAIASDEEIDKRLANWGAYNAKLLRYYFRNRSRCVLIHSRELRKCGSHRLAEILRTKTDLPLSPCVDAAENQQAHVLGQSNRADTNDYSRPDDRGTVLAEFLVEYHLDRNLQQRALYDELQSVADLSSTEGHNDSLAAAERWRLWFERQADMVMDLQRVLQNQQHMKDSLEALINAEQLLRLQHELGCDEIRISMQEIRALRLGLESCRNALENERSYVQELNNGMEELRSKLSSPTPLTGAAERVKSHLSYRLGSVIVSDAKSPIAFPFIPLVLMLETLRYYRMPKNRNAQQQALPKLDEYADVAKADAVKRQLSYRLGNTLVRRAKSPIGWVILPFALIRQIQAFRRSRKHR